MIKMKLFALLMCYLFGECQTLILCMNTVNKYCLKVRGGVESNKSKGKETSYVQGNSNFRRETFAFLEAMINFLRRY